jgi:pyridoxine 4-dehydrogenase
MSNASKAGTIKIGDMTVNRIGLGTNRITDTPDAEALLHRAVELGVNFIDTAHRYTGGASETMIGKTLAPYEDGLVIATKGGLTNGGPAASPDQLRKDLEDSLERLKVSRIDLYQLHRVDPKVPMEDSLRTLKELQQAGKIRHIGISEVTLEQLKEARKIVDIVSVQNEYNVVVRKYEALVEYCEDQSIVFIPWFPLGGLSGGAATVNGVLRDIAKTYNATPQQIALAWLLKRSPMILPIPGTLSVDHLITNLESADIILRDKDYELLTKMQSA